MLGRLHIGSRGRQTYDHAVGPLPCSETAGFCFQSKGPSTTQGAEIERFSGRKSRQLAGSPRFGQQVQPADTHLRIGSKSNPDAGFDQRREWCGAMTMGSIRQWAMRDSGARGRELLYVVRDGLDRMNAQGQLAEGAVLCQPPDRRPPE
jgi:hypothetical protein